MFLLFLEGLLLGLSVSIPLGPIGIVCLHRTLSRGRLSGLVSGLGAATADTFFAAVAGFSLSVFLNFFQQQKFYLTLGGGLVLIVLGAFLFFSNTIKQARQEQKSNKLISDFVSVFFLTISNPLTIIFFTAILSGLNILEDGSFDKTAIVITGIFFGSLSWWFTLTTLVNLFRRKFRLRRLWYLNKITAVLIILFGLFAMISAFYRK